MTERSRLLIIGCSLGLFATALLLAQPKPEAPKASPTAPKLTAAEATPTPEVTVRSGPEPWYTVFGTSEVVGFIEPCG